MITLFFISAEPLQIPVKGFSIARVEGKKRKLTSKKYKKNDVSLDNSNATVLTQVDSLI